MKARKSLSFQPLVAEVLHQLTFFKPEPKTIKSRVEDLITRDFLKRDESDPTTLTYLA